MSTTNIARLRQRAQRLEIPDAPLSTVVIQSVEAACHKFLQARGMIYKLTRSYSAKKEARGNKTKEAVERCAESGTFPTRSDNDGQTVSMIVR
jgi:hypothetical protein